MKKNKSKVIILDRDGVINFDSPDYIKSEAEWEPIPGSLEAIATLNAHGYSVVVATNQSGIARGFYDLDTFQRINQKMQNLLKTYGGCIDHVFFCPHGPDDHCLCRKPAPGLFHQIADHYHIDFYKIRVPAVGDSLRDLQAAQAAGCRPILTLTGNGSKTALKLIEISELKHIEIYQNLGSVVEALVANDE